jgi:hypothetical protein
MAEHNDNFTHSTALELQRVMAELKSALREQQHMQSDLADMRQRLQSVDKLLREGDGGVMPLTMRMMLVETRTSDLAKRLDDYRDSQKIGRDWWMKVLGNLTVGALFAGAGLLLSLYMMSKGVAKLP